MSGRGSSKWKSALYGLARPAHSVASHIEVVGGDDAKARVVVFPRDELAERVVIVDHAVQQPQAAALVVKLLVVEGMDEAEQLASLLKEGKYGALCDFRGFEGGEQVMTPFNLERVYGALCATEQQSATEAGRGLTVKAQLLLYLDLVDYSKAGERPSRVGTLPGCLARLRLESPEIVFPRRVNGGANLADDTG